jgi:alpha-beta hydrolase superfamily lysophospholipase
MAQRGFVALTFDFRGWGESGGQRRQLENPQQKIDDIIAAAATCAPGPKWLEGASAAWGFVPVQDIW